MFKYVKRLLKALNANAHPGDIAHAVSLGLLLALVPKGNLLWPFLFILTMFIRMNKGAFFISFICLAFAVPFVDVLIERLGYGVLSLKVLTPVFTAMYQTPFVGWTRFNNTMVTGGLIAGIIMYVPAYALSRLLITMYRTHLQPKIVGSKAYKVFCNLPLIKQIIGASGLGGFDS